MFHTDLTPFGVDMERLTKQRLERFNGDETAGLGRAYAHGSSEYSLCDQFGLYAGSPCDGDPALCAGAREWRSFDLREKQHESEGVATLWRLYVRHAPTCGNQRLCWASGGWTASWEWLVNGWAWTVLQSGSNRGIKGRGYSSGRWLARVKRGTRGQDR